MVTIYGLNEEWEYPWEINPLMPHEHGEPQDFGETITHPCKCTPLTISEEEFDKRRESVFRELQLDH